jgi:hypothetical protein
MRYDPSQFSTAKTLIFFIIIIIIIIIFSIRLRIIVNFSDKL